MCIIKCIIILDATVFLHNDNISSALSQNALMNKRDRKEIEQH